jgi:hypothetical protein
MFFFEAGLTMRLALTTPINKKILDAVDISAGVSPPAGGLKLMQPRTSGQRAESLQGATAGASREQGTRTSIKRLGRGHDGVLGVNS